MKLAPKIVLNTASILTGCGLLPLMPFNNGSDKPTSTTYIDLRPQAPLEVPRGPEAIGTESRSQRFPRLSNSAMPLTIRPTSIAGRQVCFGQSRRGARAASGQS